MFLIKTWQEKESVERTRVKKPASKSPGKKIGKKQKSVNYKSDVPVSPLVHTPTVEAPEVAKGDFTMELDSVLRHIPTPGDNSNDPPVVDIFSTPRGATTSQAIIISPIRLIL